MGYVGFKNRQQFAFDGYILCGSALLFIAYVIFWQLWPIGILSVTPELIRPIIARLMLLIGPMTIYALGAVLFLRFFFTRLRGWSRYAYLLGAFYALLPIIGMTVFLALLASGNGRP
jgi:hypothetical protein